MAQKLKCYYTESANVKYWSVTVTNLNYVNTILSPLQKKRQVNNLSNQRHGTHFIHSWLMALCKFVSTNGLDEHVAVQKWCGGWRELLHLLSMCQSLLVMELLLLHPFNGLFSRTTWVSRYQEGKTSLDLNQARDDGVLGWQWHQLDHRQTICTSLQTRLPHQNLITQFL